MRPRPWWKSRTPAAAGRPSTRQRGWRGHHADAGGGVPPAEPVICLDGMNTVFVPPGSNECVPIYPPVNPDGGGIVIVDGGTQRPKRALRPCAPANRCASGIRHARRGRDHRRRAAASAAHRGRRHHDAPAARERRRWVRLSAGAGRGNRRPASGVGRIARTCLGHAQGGAKEKHRAARLTLRRGLGTATDRRRHERGCTSQDPASFAVEPTARSSSRHRQRSGWRVACRTNSLSGRRAHGLRAR